MKQLRSYLLVLLVSCGQNSLIDCNKAAKSRCVEQTDDEKAVAALNSADYQTVIDILKPLIDAEPTAYFRYPRLATAYAGLAGFDLANAATAKSSGAQDGLNAFNAFLPAIDALRLDLYHEYLGYMGQARDLLASMPEEQRTADTDIYYSASSEFQYVLYLCLHVTMCLNVYQFFVDGDSIDADGLFAFKECPATEMIANLLQAALAAQSNNQELSSKVKELETKILGEEGANAQAKLEAYVIKQQKGS